MDGCKRTARAVHEALHGWAQAYACRPSWMGASVQHVPCMKPFMDGCDRTHADLHGWCKRTARAVHEALHACTGLNV
eukprot:365883-Chlamydomonas_euryale.AAC.3